MGLLGCGDSRRGGALKACQIGINMVGELLHYSSLNNVREGLVRLYDVVLLAKIGNYEIGRKFASAYLSWQFGTKYLSQEFGYIEFYDSVGNFISRHTLVAKFE